MRDLSRLFRPRSIAVFGGGFWGPNVVEQCLKMGFDGQIWPVHPTRDEMHGLPCYRTVEELPEAPDASFIGGMRIPSWNSSWLDGAIEPGTRPPTSMK